MSILVINVKNNKKYIMTFLINSDLYFPLLRLVYLIKNQEQ